MSDHNEITIGRNAEGNIIVSGNNNQIEIIQRGTNKTDFEEASEAEKTDIGPNPYKGLEAFHEQDKDRFFGREELAEKLRKVYHALFESDIRFLPIIGPSGSGKSSLARAGLIPELVRNPLPAMKLLRLCRKQSRLKHWQRFLPGLPQMTMCRFQKRVNLPMK